MQMFSQDSNRSDALKAKMDDLKAQLAKCQEEYNRVRQEEFKEAVKRFLEEFNIRTIEDLNNAAMKLRGMKPEIVKEAARNIREQEATRNIPQYEPDHKDSVYRPSREHISATMNEAAGRTKKLAESAKTIFAQKPAQNDGLIPELDPAKTDNKVEVFFDEVEEKMDTSNDVDAAESSAHEEDAMQEVEPATPDEILMDVGTESSAEEPTMAAVEREAEIKDSDDTFAKTESFDLDDDAIDMNWDFGDESDTEEKSKDTSIEEPAAKDADVKEHVLLSDADIDEIADELDKIELSDEQVMALRNKVIVVRAAHKLSRALLTAQQELDPSMPAKDVSMLFDYDPAAMKGTSIREKYREADKMIAALDDKITEQNTPKAYLIYVEFKDFPDFIRNRAMTLVAMEIEEYFG